MHKEWHLPEVLSSFDKCSGLWPLQEPHQLRLSFFQDMNGSHFTFYIIFKLKHVLSSTVATMHTPKNFLSFIYHENNHFTM